MTRDPIAKIIFTTCLFVFVMTTFTGSALAFGRKGHGEHPRDMGRKAQRAEVFMQIAQHLVRPEMVAKHQDEIGLTQTQKEAIKAKMQEAEATLSGLEFDLAAEIEDFIALLESDIVDQDETLAQLDRVLDIENLIKKERLGLAVAVKNELTPDQLEQLQEKRRDKIERFRKMIQKNRAGEGRGTSTE